MLRIATVTIASMLWFGVPAIVVGQGAPMQEDRRVSRAETEILVKADLAARLKVPVDRIQVVESSDRTWPDESLGCGSRKGLKEPIPVSGFDFTLAHSGRQFVYHSDRNGHFRRCQPPRKPLGPISR